ncbi:MAG: hypothetical protein ABIR62_02000 [Dokdonella sp.]|uniref:hypothetical protein n=1 Tax=Dokdonella sp. TaxID=2291710 RepID=UPI0032654EF7
MNTKMKVLSLAIVGLVGFAGSAFAVCPAGPTTAEGGAWTSKASLPDPTSSPVTVVAGGLDASACKLTAALAPITAASATVRYTHAASEPNYRFQFLIDNTLLSSYNATDGVVVFQAPATTTAHGLSRLLRVSVVAGPGGAKRVRFIASCGTGSFTCAQSFATDLLPGVNRIEGKLTVGAGAAGSLSYFVNAAAGAAEPAASGTIANLDNAAWGGVSAASLGLTAPSQTWADTHGNQAVGFDTFDSRRNTYIGF